MGEHVTVVAGGGGFIGGHLVRRLRQLGHAPIRSVDIKPIDQWYQRFDDVENVQADLKRRENCQNACRDAAQVFNLAADMGGMGFLERNKAHCMLNVLINTHLLEAARNAGVSRYFFASSACVYSTLKQDVADRPPFREDAYPAMPEDGYGWEKLFSERMCRHFMEDFSLATRVARFDNVYGPHGAWKGGRERAPAAICRKAIEAVETGRQAIEVWGDGTQTRSFIYVDDCIDGILKIAAGDVAEPLNLSSDDLVTINDLVDVVEELAGVRLQREYNLSAPQGVRVRTSDSSRLKHALGWSPRTSLQDGMANTYHWIRQAYQRETERSPLG